jgi:hypothetical protein
MSVSHISDDLDRDYAPAWRPEPGDKLVGTITDISERAGFDGEPYPIITVQTDDGSELAFHAFHTVAQTELAKLRPQVGDPLGVKYLGRVQSENSRASYHSYRVRTKAKAGVNWAKYGDGDAPEPPPDVPVDNADLPEPPAMEGSDDEPLPF